MALLTACLLGALPARAQDGAGAAAPQPWVVECSSRNSPDGRLICQMSQTIVSRENGQRVMAATINKPARDGNPLLLLALPHGISLPSGVNLWVDDAKREQFPILTADQDGSYASVELSSERLAAMRRGKQLNVAIKAASGAELVLQFSLAGFSSAAGNL